MSELKVLDGHMVNAADAARLQHMQRFIENLQKVKSTDGVPT